MLSSSLLHFPPFSVAGSSSLGGGGDDHLCEFESVLCPASSAPTPRPMQIIKSMPVIQGSRMLLTTNNAAGDLSLLSGEMSAKNAFLPSKNGQQVRKAVTQWYEEGFISALEQLTDGSSSSSSLGRRGGPGDMAEKGGLFNKLVVTIARSILALYRMTTNIHYSFNPHLMMSGEDMIHKFSQVRDWKSSLIRGMEWHPHTDKFAVAFKDDTIEVHGQHLPTSPLLKYKQQRGISSLAWRPLSASELAVGCLHGVLIWTLDPTSVAVRPSASSVVVLASPGHAPVTSINWDPRGKLLLSASAADTSMILWSPSSETMIPLRRVGGGGVHLVAWSPGRAHAILAATPSTVFRVWETRTWTHERWNVLEGHIRSACWSPSGNHLLFTTSAEPVIFCLNFSSSSAAAASSNAFPVVDLAAIAYETEEGEDISIGGIAQCIRWDPLSSRLAVTFEDTDLVALFSTSVRPILSLSPIGFIRGRPEERPACIEFAKKFDEGALLTVAWSSGRIQYVPLMFIPNVANQSFAKQIILDPDLDASLAGRHEIFSIE